MRGEGWPVGGGVEDSEGAFPRLLLSGRGSKRAGRSEPFLGSSALLFALELVAIPDLGGFAEGAQLLFCGRLPLQLGWVLLGDRALSDIAELELVGLLLRDSLRLRFHFDELRLHLLDVGDSDRDRELNLFEMTLVAWLCLLDRGRLPKILGPLAVLMVLGALLLDPHGEDSLDREL